MFRDVIHRSSHAVSGQYKVQVSLCGAPAGTSLKEGWCCIPEALLCLLPLLD